jgi:hypothetical protein
VCFLLVPVAVVVVALFRKQELSWGNRAFWSGVSIPIAFTCITLGFVSFASPAPFFRYLCPIIPPVIAIAGLLVAAASRLHWLAGAVLLIIAALHQPMGDFMYELTHDYDGPIEGIVKFLQANAEPEDVVAITYGDMPLKFYTDLRIVGGLTGEDLTPCKTARWVVIRRHTICEKDFAVLQYLRQHLDPHSYHKIKIDFPDAPFENRESPNEHLFRTASFLPHVSIWERIEAPGQ